MNLKFKAFNKQTKEWMYSDWKYGIASFWELIQNDFTKEFSEVVISTGRIDNKKSEIYFGDIVCIDRDDKKYTGAVNQLDGGQFYIEHEDVCLKYQHQIHCEVCDTESPSFFLDFFEPYEIEVIGSICWDI